MAEPLWSPSAARIQAANITRFAELAHATCGVQRDYPSLHSWSTENPSAFWQLLWTFCEVQATKTSERVLVEAPIFKDTKWFPDAELNFAENLLRYRDDQIAIIARGEDGRRQELSYKELYRSVACIQQHLLDCGVGRGDRVAGFIPNIPEAIIAMLATASIGAVWSSCSPDFGTSSVLDRFGQIEPKVLFVADGYTYNGKSFDCLEKTSQVLESISSIENTVIIPYLSKKPAFKKPHQLFSELVRGTAQEVQFTPLPFNHPLYILYSSGTTGTPKCIVHGAGGTLLQHLKELVLHTDLTRKDRMCYFTTCGWMMWNWLASSLATGATVILYEGSPTHPKPDILFDLVDEEQMSVFGTSAKYISAIEKLGVVPRKKHKLSSLKTVLSTGSTLAPESFDYVYRDWKTDVCLSSISGGTDIVSCFALGNPTLPVYRGELQAVGLGMSVKAFDETGTAVTGEPGELVCTKPFPAMPVGFWNDPDGSKYHNSYFSEFENVWRHGDWVEFTEHQGLIIHGRSDTTLNPGGVRIGTAEIYRQVEQLDEILESLVVGQQWQGDERIVLFVRLRQGKELTPELEKRIKTKLKTEASPRHVPAKIISVPDIPRTRSGKIAELTVKNLIHGRAVKNQHALANPECLSFYKNITLLESN